MWKWFDFSKKEIVRLFIIRINGGGFSNYFHHTVNKKPLPSSKQLAILECDLAMSTQSIVLNNA